MYLLNSKIVVDNNPGDDVFLNHYFEEGRLINFSFQLYSSILIEFTKELILIGNLTMNIANG